VLGGKQLDTLTKARVLAAVNTYYAGEEWQAQDKKRPDLGEKLDAAVTQPQIRKDLVTINNLVRPYEMAKSQKASKASVLLLGLSFLFYSFYF